MEKKVYCYQTDENSNVGRKLKKFWDAALRAARKADQYAAKYGADTYLPPVQFFEGGVDYLEFETTPDLRVWRKRFEVDGKEQYEPNCMYNGEILVVPDRRFQPSSTWDRTFSKTHLTWEQAKPKYSLRKWAEVINYTLTGNREEDEKAVEDQLRNKSFVPYVQFYGDLPANAKVVPNYLRQAIQAEKDRQALPVIEVEWLFAILDAVSPFDNKKASTISKKDLASAFANTETPMLFYYQGKFYVSLVLPCHAEGLHEITEGTFNYKKNIALREQPS